MIYFVRHGQTDWNLQQKCQGRADLSINENGKKQAEEIKKLLKDVKIDKYFCSPLIRTVQTFEIIVGRKPTREEIDERLIERDFGEFEGLKRDEFDFLKFNNVNAVQNYERAETVAQVRNRAESFVDFLNREYAGKNIFIVSHGGFGIIFKSVFDGVPKSGNLLEV